jgi:hypothetical protein
MTLVRDKQFQTALLASAGRSLAPFVQAIFQLEFSAHHTPPERNWLSRNGDTPGGYSSQTKSLKTHSKSR